MRTNRVVHLLLLGLFPTPLTPGVMYPATAYYYY